MKEFNFKVTHFCDDVVAEAFIRSFVDFCISYDVDHYSMEVKCYDEK